MDILMAIIEFENITRKITEQSGEELLILSDVSFAVNEGEVFSIIGPSGSGKSSILRLMNRLDEPASGEIRFHGKPVVDYPPQKLRRKIALAFQSPKLFGPTVYDDLAYSYSIDPRAGGNDDTGKRCIEMVKLVGLAGEFLERSVDRLSGGEKMRVAIARALMRHPEVLLLDEPTSGLDPEAAKGLLHTVRELNMTKNLTIVVVTHRFNYARLIGHRTLMLIKGRVVEIGETAEFFSSPTTEEAKIFIEMDGEK